jgi:hypothetical protein
MPGLTRKPRKGDKVRWPHWKAGRVATVNHVDGNLCWIDEPGKDTMPFIWNFREGMNTLAEFVEA